MRPDFLMRWASTKYFLDNWKNQAVVNFSQFLIQQTKVNSKWKYPLILNGAIHSGKAGQDVRKK